MTTSTSFTFQPGKDAQALYPDFAPAFERFFIAHGGANKEHTLSDYTGIASHLNRVAELIGEAINTGTEVPMYRPLAKALTLISLDVCQGDKVIAFVPNANVSLRVMDGARDKPDIVGFFVNREEAESLVNDEIQTTLVPSAYEIIVVIECKVKVDPLLQGQRYCFAVARHRFGSPLQYGLVINTKRFRLISISLDDNGSWGDVQWEEQSVEPIMKLYESIRLIWKEASTVRDERVPVPEYEIALDDAKRPIAMHSTRLGGRPYWVLPIFCGRGNGRKPFVALAFAANGPQHHIVLKYSWPRNSDRSRERYFLEKLKDAPGVVRINEALSSDSIQFDEESGRNQNLLAFETIACSITSCTSVLEFLETMYDLLEVLHYHTHEAHVLHRDISLGNVLVPVKDIPQTPKKEANWDKYQFISDYQDDEDDTTSDDISLESKPRRVRVVLADFDNARDLTMETNDLKHATGTPMFMANDVLAPRSVTAISPALSKPTAARIRAALAESGKKYHTDGDESKWDALYNGLHQLSYKYEENAELHFQHGAMHDAESVFYLCLLIFSRMMRKGEELSDDDLAKRKVERGYVFEQLAKKTAGEGNTEPFPRHLPSNGFEAQFYNMLHVIYDYLTVPWYNVSNTGHGEPFEFHLHDFMQRLFLKEIRRLRFSSSIPLEPYPLAVKSKIAVYGSFFTFYLSTSGLSTFPTLPQPESNKESTDGSNKRPKRDNTSDFMKNIKFLAVSRRSSYTAEKAKQLMKNIPEELVMILYHKRKEFLWLASDKIGVSKGPDSSHNSGRDEL